MVRTYEYEKKDNIIPTLARTALQVDRNPDDLDAGRRHAASHRLQQRRSEGRFRYRDSASDETSWITEYIYDENDYPAETISYYGSGKEEDHGWHHYDESGHLLSERWVSENGISHGVKELTYDTSGNLLTETHYDQDGIYSLTECAYDRKGNKTQEKFTHYKSASQSYMKTYKYDAKGRLIREEEQDAEGRVTTWKEYKYNKRCQLIRETSSVYTTDRIIWEYEYDRHGNRVKETRVDENGAELKHFEYEYMEAPKPEE